MATNGQLIDIYRGDAVGILIAITNEDGTTFDPTTANSIKWRCALNWYGKALISKELGNGTLWLAEGGVAFDLTPQDTDLDPGDYYMELKIFGSPSGAAHVALTGSVIIRKSMKMGNVLAANAAFTGSSQARLILTAS